MSEDANPQQEYLEANAARIAAFETHATELLALAGSTVVELEVPTYEVLGTENLVTKEVILADTSEFTPEEAEDIAHNERLLAIGTAKTHTAGLRARTAIRRISTEGPDAVKTMRSGVSVMRSRLYNLPGLFIEVSSTEIFGEDSSSVAKTTEVVVADDLVVDTFTIESVAGKPVDVREDNRPVSDDFYGRCVDLLTAQDQEILLDPRAVGLFEEEAELDGPIEEALARHKGSPNEEAVKKLLIEYKERAIAAKANREMRKMFGDSNPTIDRLDESDAIVTSLNHG